MSLYPKRKSFACYCIEAMEEPQRSHVASLYQIMNDIEFYGESFIRLIITAVITMALAFMYLLTSISLQLIPQHQPTTFTALILGATIFVIWMIVKKICNTKLKQHIAQYHKWHDDHLGIFDHTLKTIISIDEELWSAVRQHPL